MRKTQIQLDEQTYQKVRRRAFERNISMAEVIREALASEFGAGGTAPRPELTFVGIGSSGARGAISEDHDAELARLAASDER